MTSTVEFVVCLCFAAMQWRHFCSNAVTSFSHGRFQFSHGRFQFSQGDYKSEVDFNIINRKMYGKKRVISPSIWLWRKIALRNFLKALYYDRRAFLSPPRCLAAIFRQVPPNSAMKTVRILAESGGKWRHLAEYEIFPYKDIMRG